MKALDSIWEISAKLTNDYFDSRLATTSTVRNWRTVLALVAMAGAP